MKTIFNLKKNDPHNQTCQTCFIIRFFLISVFLIILLALIQKDKLHYLNFVTPENAAILILIGGLLIFLGKLYKYFVDTKNKN